MHYYDTVIANLVTANWQQRACLGRLNLGEQVIESTHRENKDHCIALADVVKMTHKSWVGWSWPSLHCESSLPRAPLGEGNRLYSYHQNREGSPLSKLYNLLPHLDKALNHWNTWITNNATSILNSAIAGSHCIVRAQNRTEHQRTEQSGTE